MREVLWNKSKNGGLCADVKCGRTRLILLRTKLSVKWIYSNAKNSCCSNKVDHKFSEFKTGVYNIVKYMYTLHRSKSNYYSFVDINKFGTCTFSINNILCNRHTFDIASKFWNVTAPGTILVGSVDKG